VAHGEPSFKKVLKTLATALRKEMVTEPELRAILAEVEVESVKPFAGRPDYQSRSERLDALRKAMLSSANHPGGKRVRPPEREMAEQKQRCASC